MAVGDIYEVRHEGFSNEAERWNVVWHFELTNDVGTSLFATSLNLAVMMGTEFGVSMLGLMHEDWNFLSTRAVRVWPSIGISASDDAGNGSGQVLASGSMPADIAAVVTKRTDQPGARFRGRTFFGGLAEEHANAGALTVAYTDTLVSAWDSYAAVVGPDVGGNAWRSVVFSRKQVEDVLVPVAAPIVRIMVDRVLRNMRPRSTTLSQYVSPP